MLFRSCRAHCGVAERHRPRPELADIGNVVEAKIQGIARYESQVPHLFGSVAKMAEAVRTQGGAVALSTGRSGSVERYWAAVRRS